MESLYQTKSKTKFYKHRVVDTCPGNHGSKYFYHLSSVTWRGFGEVMLGKFIDKKYVAICTNVFFALFCSLRFCGSVDVCGWFTIT